MSLSATPTSTAKGASKGPTCKEQGQDISACPMRVNLPRGLPSVQHPAAGTSLLLQELVNKLRVKLAEIYRCLWTLKGGWWLLLEEIQETCHAICSLRVALPPAH